MTGSCLSCNLVGLRQMTLAGPSANQKGVRISGLSVLKMGMVVPPQKSLFREIA